LLKGGNPRYDPQLLVPLVLTAGMICSLFLYWPESKTGRLYGLVMDISRNPLRRLVFRLLHRAARIGQRQKLGIFSGFCFFRL